MISGLRGSVGEHDGGDLLGLEGPALRPAAQGRPHPVGPRRCGAGVDVPEHGGARTNAGHRAETRTPGGGGLEPQHPGEGDHGVLGHGVGTEQRHGDQPGQRGGDDDVPVALGPHDRVDRLDAVDHAAQVDVDRAVPVLRRQLLDAPGDGDPGVVVEHVDPAVLVHHRTDDGRERLPVAHVEQHVGGRGGGGRPPPRCRRP